MKTPSTGVVRTAPIRAGRAAQIPMELLYLYREREKLKPLQDFMAAWVAFGRFTQQEPV